MKSLIIALTFFCSVAFGSYVVPDQSITTSKLKDLNVTTGKLANNSVTFAKLAAPVYSVSSSSGSFTTSSSSYTDVTNLTVTITATGKPVLILMQPDGDTGGSSGALIGGGPSSATGLALLKDSSQVAQSYYNNNAGSSQGLFPAGFTYLDPAPSAGSHTYKMQAKVFGGSCQVTNWKLVAVEL